MSNGPSRNDPNSNSGKNPPDPEPQGGVSNPPHVLWAAAAGGLIGGLVGALIGSGLG